MASVLLFIGTCANPIGWRVPNAVGLPGSRRMTDTLLIECRTAPVDETRDLDENAVLDVDIQGNICAITIEHASEGADAPHFSYERVAAYRVTYEPE